MEPLYVLNSFLPLIKVAGKDNYDPKYSYGWQRAEILGALVNAVFLLALCFMIIIEAIERFVSPQEITNPLLVLIVGGAGLAGNLVGLLLFHGKRHYIISAFVFKLSDVFVFVEHGHGHGHGHSHGHEHDVENANEQHSGGHLNMKGVSYRKKVIFLLFLYL